MNRQQSEFALARRLLVDELRERPIAMYRRLMTPGGTRRSEAAKLAARLRSDGTWHDIDFQQRDETGVGFPPLRHVARALQLALNGYGDAAVRALDAWRRVAVHSENWWYNEIAAPQLVADTCISAYARLTPHDRARWGRWLAGTVGPVKLTGDNLLWSKAIVLRHGLLTDDADLLTAANGEISSVLRVTKGDGIQQDFTYHHHGALLYSGNYGAALAPEVTLWMLVLHGTRWAFSDRDVAVFVDFLLEGQRWAVHGGGFDFTTMGRAVSRPDAHNSVDRLRTSLDRLLKMDPPRRDELVAFDQSLDGRPGPVGSRYFPCSDYLVHRRPTWSVAVRMSSVRTIPTESILGENLRGRYLADGVTAVRVGHEPEDGYRAVLPVWDWACLPGTTTPTPRHVDGLVPRPNGVTGASCEVGGWSDGLLAMAAMRLSGTDDFVDGLKAWFCFENCVVALGAAITAPDVDTTVRTTIDQRLAVGTLTTQKAGRYVHHARIGYVCLDGQPLRAEVQTRVGSWADISRSGSPDPLTAPVFRTFLDHGPAPRTASYAVLILPDAQRTQTEQCAQTPPVAVESNTAELQSVRCLRTGTLLSILHRKGGPAFLHRKGRAGR